MPFFTIFGVVFFMTAPLLVLVDTGGATLKGILFSAIAGALLATCNSYVFVKGYARGIQSIKKFTARMSECDYTQDKMLLDSRDEFGLLINDLNRFCSMTKGLLHNFQETVQSSAIVATALSDNIFKIVTRQ